MDAKLLDSKKKLGTKVTDIRKWTDQDTNWLDELYGLSRGIPPAKDVVFSEATLSSSPPGSQSEVKGLIAKSGASAARRKRSLK